MAYTKRHLIATVCAFFGLLAPVVWGQSSGGSVNVTVSFMLLNGEASELKMDSSGTIHAVALRKRVRTREFVYQGPATLTLYQPVQTGSVVTKQPMARIEIPPAMRRAIVFLLDEGDGHMKGFASSLPTAGLQTGEAMFVNASGAPLAGRIGDHTVDLPMGATAPFSTKLWRNGEFPLELAVQQSGEWTKVLSGRISFAADQRSLLVILPPRQPGSLRVQYFNVTEFDAQPVRPGVR